MRFCQREKEREREREGCAFDLSSMYFGDVFVVAGRKSYDQSAAISGLRATSGFIDSDQHRVDRQVGGG